MNENNYYSKEYYSEPNADRKGSKKGSKAKLIAVTAICCALIGAGSGAAGAVAAQKYFSDNGTSAVRNDDSADTDNSTKSDDKTEPRISSVVKTADSESGTLMTASDVYENCVGSTVGITTSIKTNYFGYTTTSAASGSGFIISENGYIVTNNHVIADAESITVTTYSGETYNAELIGADESSDIAVLKIDADGLTPLTLGSSDALKVGEDVVAIGNPLGELTFSLTSGVVSALDREVTTENATMTLIQTDCAINAGNSGGALLNMYGQVVGITNAKYSSNSTGEASIDNIGFAIPVDQVKGIISSIIDNGYAIKPYIGVTISDVSSDAAAYGLPQGAAIRSVTDDSPADKAGLEVNDIVTAIDGKDITEASALSAAVKKSQAGDTLTLTVYRKGETLEIKVKVEETKGDPTSSDNDSSGKEQPGGGMDIEDFFNDFGSFERGF